ncbi:DMT family transporter [Cohaesibacter sp. CAU 1516]|uniref:DMT family transporter n=1 Tax=Cohaesibacter sp. CAU 1516 TaxID=2576038 RepID=UPI0010FEC801|nr:DMT family transporter [Cohaesibacter sp. CAU 1516]TLP43350.1 DMT family transporter [Cohaesibacter sp. CAU 1516]
MTTAPQGTVATRVDAAAIRTDKGNLYGIMIMQVAILFFVTNDLLTKMGGESLSTGQVVVVRGIVALTLLACMLAWTKEYKRLRAALHPTILLRAACETIAALLFLTALAQLPLANIGAIMLTIPLASTAAAAMFFGEQVGIRRWSAIVVGFVGVMAIVRPGLEGFTFYSLFALGAVIGATARDVITRRIPVGAPLWGVTFITMLMSTIGGGLLNLTESWEPVSTISMLMLALAAVFLTLGQYAIVIAMNNGEISVVSSFRYISMPISLFYGYVFYSDIPDLQTWFGIALILASGIYTIFRERTVSRMRRQAKATEAAESGG